MKICQVIIFIVIIILLLIHWQEKSFAGTVELDSSNINSMTRVNLYNNIWQQPKGFLWYNEQLEQQSNKLPVTQSKLSLKSEPVIEPHDERIESLKQQFNRAQRKALDDPSFANVIIAQRLQKQIMEKAQKFATMWQLATILDHQLSNINEPSNSLHKRLYEEKQGQENDYKLKKLAKNWGLILQLATNCAYCKAFTPIVKQFANKYGFQLIFVAGNEEKFQDVTTVKDPGLLQKLNPENIVPVLYLVASNGQKIYPIARSIISEDKIIENIINIAAHDQALLKVGSDRADGVYHEK